MENADLPLTPLEFPDPAKIEPDSRNTREMQTIGTNYEVPSRSRIFDKSRTLQSVKLCKERLVSSQNVLKIPIEYNLDQFKMQRSDATKLFCAVRNYYKHQEGLETLEENSHVLDSSPDLTQKRRKVRDAIQQRYSFENNKAVQKDLWKIKFLTRSTTQNSLRAKQIADEKANLDAYLQKKVAQLHLTKKEQARNESRAADQDFVQQRLSSSGRLGSQLNSTTPLNPSRMIPQLGKQQSVRQIVKMTHLNKQHPHNKNRDIPSAASKTGKPPIVLRPIKELRDTQSRLVQRASPRVPQEHLINLRIPINKRQATQHNYSPSMRQGEQSQYQKGFKAPPIFELERKRSRTAAEGNTRNFLPQTEVNEIKKEGVSSISNFHLNEHISSQNNASSDVAQTNFNQYTAIWQGGELSQDKKHLATSESQQTIPKVVPIPLRRKLAQQSLKHLIYKQIEQQHKLKQKKKGAEETGTAGNSPTKNSSRDARQISIQGSQARLQLKVKALPSRFSIQKEVFEAKQKIATGMREFNLLQPSIPNRRNRSIHSSIGSQSRDSQLEAIGDTKLFNVVSQQFLKMGKVGQRNCSSRTSSQKKQVYTKQSPLVLSSKRSGTSTGQDLMISGRVMTTDMAVQAEPMDMTVMDLDGGGADETSGDGYSPMIRDKRLSGISQINNFF